MFIAVIRDLLSDIPHECAANFASMDRKWYADIQAGAESKKCIYASTEQDDTRRVAANEVTTVVRHDSSAESGWSIRHCVRQRSDGKSK
jgi:hypothetical protein